MKLTTASDAIRILEAEFQAGRIVEIIEGLPVRRFALIRKTRTADELVPLILGPMTDGEFEMLIAWHGRKWQQLLRNKKFRRWEKKHPIPGGE